MCGRYLLVQKLGKIAQRFEVDIPDNIDYNTSYNIGPGNRALVIIYDDQMRMEMMQFGLIPFWAKKSMLLINARSEGDRNQANEMNYRGAKDIINKPAFRKPIRSQRCLVIADAFVEGTTKEGLGKPYLVFLKNKIRPFAFAGIWDEWRNPDTGEIFRGFAIVTTSANSLMQKIPHHRSPVILKPSQEKSWINPKTPLTDVTAMLKPFSPELMDAYPVSADYKNMKNDYPELLRSRGESLNPDLNVDVTDVLERQGFGRKNRHF